MSQYFSCEHLQVLLAFLSLIHKHYPYVYNLLYPCYIHINPDKPINRNYKTKERHVVDYIKSKITNVDWISDKKIKDGCSLRRPDLMLDLGYQIIIVEVDENQHNVYDCSCENKRIMELSQDVGHRPIIFIRFNPDDYKNVNNENITSCLGIDNRSGVLIVKKSKQKYEMVQPNSDDTYDECGVNTKNSFNTPPKQ